MTEKDNQSSKKRKLRASHSSNRNLTIKNFYESDDSQAAKNEEKIVKKEDGDHVVTELTKPVQNTVERLKAEAKRSSSVPKKNKGKKGVKKDYVKGKYNTKVEEVGLSKYFDGTQNELFCECCPYCSNRNPVRAAKENNIDLMKKCIASRKSISSVFSSWSVGIQKNSLIYALENENKEMIQLLFEYLNKEGKRTEEIIEPRVGIPSSKINLTETGTTSEYMVGVKTRAIGVTRGNKKGNNALLEDDVTRIYDDNGYQMFHDVTLWIMEKCKNIEIVKFIESLESLMLSQLEGTTRYGPNFNFLSYIYEAVKSGNYNVAKHFLSKTNQLTNYGFNQLHSDVLNLENPEDISIKVITSLTKKPQTNQGITPMHVASINPNPKFIEKLVTLGGDWNFLDLNQRKPIHFAAACESEGPLNYLISLGALIDEGDKQKITPLMIACQYGRTKNVEILLAKKANPMLKSRFTRNSAFHVACEYGQIEVVKILLDTCPDIKIDLPGRDQMTGLCQAALGGHLELVKLLVERGAKVTKKDKWKRTPLLNAVRAGHLQIVTYLLSKGSEFDSPDSSKNTPIHYACAYGWIEIVDALIKAGADPNAQNAWKITPLEIAFLKNHLYIVRQLLDKSLCDVNTKFNFDNRLIHYCFKKITPQSLYEIKYFVQEKKADINAQNYFGEGILHLLAEYSFDKFYNNNANLVTREDSKKKTVDEIKADQRERYKDLMHKIFELLRETNQLQVDPVTKGGKTPLQIALEQKNQPFIDEIIQMNPKLTFQDKKGVTILHLIVPLVFGEENDRKLVQYIFNSVKTLTNEDRDLINNAFDSNGLTPLLFLMHTYKKKVAEIYSRCIEHEEKVMKLHIYEHLNDPKEPNQTKKEKISDDDEDNNDEEEEEEEGSETSAHNVKNATTSFGGPSFGGPSFGGPSFGGPSFGGPSFGGPSFGGPSFGGPSFGGLSFPPTNNFGGPSFPPTNNFSTFNNQPNQFINPYTGRMKTKDEIMREIVLDKKEQSVCLMLGKARFTGFLEYFLGIIQQLIEFKANPLMKVGKLSEFRIKITSNEEEKKEKEKKYKSRTERIISQYMEKFGKYTVLMFLMAYPYQNILNYFLDVLHLNPNEINLFRENCLLVLLNEITNIRKIEKENDDCIETTLEILLQHKTNAQQIDWKGNTSFFLASKVFSVKIMKMLSDQGADVNHFNRADENPLLFYVNKKDTNKVKILLDDFKVDINYQTSKQRTCMHYLYNNETSSTNADESLNDLLLSYNPRLDIKDISGRLPLHYLFVKIGKDFDTSPIDPISSLVKLLDHSKVSLNSDDIYGNTPLHYAAQRGSTISILTLLEKKANPNQLNKEGNSPLAYSLLFKQPNVAVNLIQEKADIKLCAHLLSKRDEKEIFAKIQEELKQRQSLLGRMSTYGISLNSSGAALSTNYDLNSQSFFGLNSTLPVGDTNRISATIQEEKEKKEEDNSVSEEDTESILGSDDEEQKEEKNQNKNEEEDDDNDYNQVNQYYNLPKQRPNLMRPFGQFGQFGQFGGFHNRNFKNENSEKTEDFESLNKKYFPTDFEKKNGITLYRICIKNDFQGLAYLFLLKKYTLMSAVEDSFYEKKFNLSKQLLSKSEDQNIYQTLNDHNQNLFHILAKISNTLVLDNSLSCFSDILYSKGISLTLKDNKGNTPLHYAARNHDMSVCQFILSKKEGKEMLKEKNEKNLTPFIYSIRGEKILTLREELFKLIFSETSASYEDKLYGEGYRLTPLIHVVRTIINKGVSIKDTKSVLVKILFALLDKGSSVLEKDSNNQNVLMLCVINNNFELLKFLLSKVKGLKKADKKMRDNKQKTLVSYCVAINNFGSYENKEMLQFLLKDGFDSELKDDAGLTPVQLSLRQKTLSNFKVLKQFGVAEAKKINLPKEEKDLEASKNVEMTDFNNPYNHEDDCEAFYQEAIKNAPPEKKIKTPNIEDYKNDQYELYQDEEFGYWDASLTKVNIQNGIYGEYMFYFIQLVHDLGKQMYIVTTQFGRIGEDGANQRSPFSTIEEAKEDFKKIFKSKTGTLWENKKQFQRQKGKYMLLQYEDVELSHKDLLKPFNYELCPPCSIVNPCVEDLIKIFTNSSVYFKALKESGVDTDFFQFSMLRKELLINAKTLMKEILTLLQDLEKLRKDNFGKIFTPEQVEQIDNLWGKVLQKSSRYYELVPKSQYKNCKIRPFDSIDVAKQEIQILDNLTYVERAISILLGAQYRSKNINPLDYIYNSLQTQFNVVDQDSDERKTIEEYIHSSSPNAKILEVFSVNRKGETERCESKWSQETNRMLLFHGTKVFNFIGIFSNGLKIAPPEAPSTGYLFGKGVYFADMYAKSIQYCDSYYDAEKKKNYKYIMLVEVVLGNQFYTDIPNNDELNLEFLKKGFNSLKANSQRGPEMNKIFVTNNGTKIPLGKIVDYPVKNREALVCHPEYVIYDTSQAVIKYLIKVEDV